MGRPKGIYFLLILSADMAGSASSSVRAAGERGDTGFAVTRFARVVTSDPARLDGVRATRTESNGLRLAGCVWTGLWITARRPDAKGLSYVCSTACCGIGHSLSQ